MHNDGVVIGKVEFQCNLNLSLNPSLNPACGDSTGSNWIEKEKVVYLLDLFKGRWEKEQCDLVCGVLLDDWAMLVYVDVLFTCDECSFNSFGSCSYSKEWVWILGTQSIHLFIHSFVKFQLGGTPGI